MDPPRLTTKTVAQDEERRRIQASGNKSQARRNKNQAGRNEIQIRRNKIQMSYPFVNLGYQRVIADSGELGTRCDQVEGARDVPWTEQQTFLKKEITCAAVWQEKVDSSERGFYIAGVPG
jgi:hypothetical protein